MKTFKKIITGAIFLILLCINLLAIPAQKTHALSAPIPYKSTQPKPTTTAEYWQACAYKVAFKASGGVLDYCDTSNDFGYNYGGASLAPNAFTDATYKTSYGKTPPSGISLLDSDANNPLVAALNTTQSLALNNLTYIGQSYTAGTAPDTNSIKFYVYQPAAGAPNGNNYALLASMNSDGSLRVLAMVFGPPDKDGKVRAAAIDQTAIGSTSTGGNCASDQAGGSCGPTTSNSGVLKGDPCNIGSDCKNGQCQKNGGDCATGSCMQNFVSFFAFIACPALDLTDSIMKFFYTQVEQQLCFKTGDTSSTSGFICDGQNSLTGRVKSAWSIFKNIASALLVIVMLVMVISQAIGGGPFDAYTVRKMLPRLVAAVIIMQLSFILLKYAIDLSNDIGSAIGNLMMAPFGGPKNMSLASMVGNGVQVATGGGATEWAFNIFGTIAAIGGVVWAVPALPLLALYVLTGTVIAFFVLVLRKLLIIMLVILAPLAFIAWLLPGTESYWKMWRQNFTKLLTMFPLIMAMLSAGRIVAYITSQADGGASMFRPQIGFAHLGSLPVPYISSATGFADLAIIIGAYFAPYFLLPKTYSWGGQLLSQAGKQVENITHKGSEPAKKFLKTREEGYREERRRKSMERVANNQDTFRSLNPIKWGSTAVDKFRSGKWDPTLGRPKFIAGGSERRARAVDAYVHAGEELEQKNIEAARSRVLREGQRIRARGGNWDRYFQAMADGKDSYEDEKLGTVKIGKRSETERDAARKQTAILGSATNWRYLEDYYQRSIDPNSDMSQEERIRARKFFDDNVQTIMPKMPHFYQGYGAAADATGSTLAGQHGVEVESIIGKFSNDIRRTTAIIKDTTRSAKEREEAMDERAKAQKSLVTYLQNFKAAADNPNISLDNGALRAVKGFLDSAEGASFRGEINNRVRPGSDMENPKENPDSREARNLNPVVAYDDLTLAPEVKAELDRIKVSLAPRINSVTGTLTQSVEQPITVAAPTPVAAGFVPPTPAPAPGTPVVRVEEGELDIRQPSGTTPREDAYIQNTRADYDNMRRRIALGETLSPEEQRRLEQIRSANPDW